MRCRIAFVHSSPVAIQAIVSFFSKCAPELESTNLLDDGLLRLFASGDEAQVEIRLSELLNTAYETYDAELAVLTCSAVSRQMLQRLRANFAKPLLKIDEPMARRAIAVGTRIGVALTFPPTLEPTRQLLLDAADEAGRAITIVSDEIPEAYSALLAGNVDTHDRMVRESITRLEKASADVVVLAQVSMARVQSQLTAETSVPVFSSLDMCLEEVRATMGIVR